VPAGSASSTPTSEAAASSTSGDEHDWPEEPGRAALVERPVAVERSIPEERPAPDQRSGASAPVADPGPGAPAADDRPAASAPGGLDTEAIRRSWPDVLDKIFSIKRVTWTLLSQHAQVLDYNGQRLLLGIGTVGIAETFRRGQHAEIVRQALIEVLGLDTTVEGQPPTPGQAAPGESVAEATAPPSGSSRPDRSTTAPGDPPTQKGQGAAGRRGTTSAQASGLSPGSGDWAGQERSDWGEVAASTPPPAWAQGGDGQDAGADQASSGAPTAKESRRESRSEPAGESRGDPQGGTRPEPTAPREPADQTTARASADSTAPAEPAASASSPMKRALRLVATEGGDRRSGPEARVDDSQVSEDDEDIEDAGGVGQPVIESVLGGKVIAELDT
jgi:DNA polymerase-3 subunit gamma/tau